MRNIGKLMLVAFLAMVVGFMFSTVTPQNVDAQGSNFSTDNWAAGGGNSPIQGRGTRLGFGVITGTNGGIAISDATGIAWVQDSAHAVQMGTGSNGVANTFQFRSTQIVGPNGGNSIGSTGEWFIDGTQLLAVVAGVTNVIDADVTTP